MSLRDELTRLLHSDMGGATVTQLATPFDLWIRNNLIHWAAGFVAYFLSVYYAAIRSHHLALSFAAYVLLQAIQVATATNTAPALIDGLIDALLPLIGFVFAWHLGTREVAQ